MKSLKFRTSIVPTGTVTVQAVSSTMLFPLQEAPELFLEFGGFPIQWRVHLLKYNVWVDIGQFLIYPVVGLSSTSTAARFVKINRKGSSSVALTIDKLRKCNRMSVIARWTALWEFLPVNNCRVNLESDSANYEIDIFPMQPDFGASDSSPRFLS